MPHRATGPQGDRKGSASPPDRHVVFYDGVCALCNGFVRFLLRRDPEGRFLFAPLQSPYARGVLARHGSDAEALAAMALLAHRDTAAETYVEGARAALATAELLGWPWRALAVLGILPDFLLDAGYGVVVRTRYRLFGRYESCPLPAPEHRRRFLDAESGEPDP